VSIYLVQHLRQILATSFTEHRDRKGWPQTRQTF